MIENAENLNMLWSHLLLEELQRCGVNRICISPGSRNSALTLAAARNPRIDCTVHFDERGAAFHALGMAKALGAPVALLCTSGSATANYLPAIVEASNAGIPLIVITADRPPELQDCGANQTIDQAGLYGKFVRWEAHVPCPSETIPASAVLTTLDQAVHRAHYPDAGPVHINCAFREPLAPVLVPFGMEACLAGLEAWRESDLPFSRYDAPSEATVPEDVLQALAKARRGIIVAGELRSDTEREAVLALARAWDWPLLPDIASGLRMCDDTRILHFYDACLLSETFRAALCPDLVLHLGGPITSKRLQQHLETARPAYVRAHPSPRRRDPGHCVTHRVVASVDAFATALTGIEKPQVDEHWMTDLKNQNTTAADCLHQWLENEPIFGECAIARALSESLAEGHALFIGNSMPIRDFDTCAAATGGSRAAYVNRGASGIDGNIATASGIARATKDPVTAIIGDLAALHDLNSLSLLRDAGAPVILIVINNDGGGIFSMLPIAYHNPHFEAYWGVPHGLSFKDAAAMFGIAYHTSRNAKALVETYARAANEGKSALIELRTDRIANERQHKELQQAVIAALG